MRFCLYSQKEKSVIQFTRNIQLPNGGLHEAFDKRVKSFNSALRSFFFPNQEVNMFSRTIKVVLALVIALLLGSLIPKQSVKAQEYVPEFGTIDSQSQSSNLQACVTIIPLSPSTSSVEVFQIRDYMMWIPLTVHGPQCVPYPPGLADAVGLMGSNELLVPRTTDDTDGFEAIGKAPISTVSYSINPEVAIALFEEALKAEANGYYPELLGVWRIEVQQASAAGVDALGPPPPPFEGESTSQMVRLTTLTELYAEAIFIKLEPEMTLYTCRSKGPECNPRTLASLCSDADLLDDFGVIFMGSYPKPITIGPVTQFEMWTTIKHTPRNVSHCPLVTPYIYTDGRTTWLALIKGDQDDSEMAFEGQRQLFKRNFFLMPLCAV